MQKNKRLWVTIAGSLLLMCPIIFDCASQKPIWGDAKTGFILRYRIQEGQILPYNTTTKHVMTMEMMGQSMETKTDGSITLDIKGNGVTEENNINTTVTIKDIKSTVKSMLGEQNLDLSSIIGKQFGMILSPIGKELEFSGTDTLKIDLGPQAGGKQDILKNNFRGFFPDLAITPVTEGMSWDTEEDENIKQQGMDIHVISHAKNLLAAIEDLDGSECLKIKTEAKGTIEGEGARMGAKMVLNGNIESSIIWYFDYKKGMLIKSAATVYTEGKISVSGQQNMIIPMTQNITAESMLLHPQMPVK